MQIDTDSFQLDIKPTREMSVIVPGVVATASQGCPVCHASKSIDTQPVKLCSPGCTMPISLDRLITLVNYVATQLLNGRKDCAACGATSAVPADTHDGIRKALGDIITIEWLESTLDAFSQRSYQFHEQPTEAAITASREFIKFLASKERLARTAP